jgi:hypothetical protein
MRMKCLLNKLIGRSWSAAIVLGVIAFNSVLAGRAEAQWLFPFGGGYRYKSVTRSGPGLSLFPGRTVLMGPSLGLSPVMGQSLAISPVQSLGFSPVIAGQSLGLGSTTLSLGAQPTFFLTSGTSAGINLSLTPQATFQLSQGTNSGATLSLSQGLNGAQVLTLSGGPPTAEHAMAVLSAGLGNDQARVNGALDGLRKKLGDVFGKFSKNVDKQTLENLLLDAAKSALAPTGFGLLGDPLIDIFLKPLINRLIGLPDGSTPAGTPPSGTPLPPPVTPAPGGAMSFTVSGTIVLTPAGGVVPPPPGRTQNGTGTATPADGVKPAPVIP